jgi:hypothetical protein
MRWASGAEKRQKKERIEDRKTKRLSSGVKGVRELQGVKTYVRGRGKGKYYERLRGVGGVNHYQGIKEIKKRRKKIEAFTIHVYIENLFK